MDPREWLIILQNRQKIIQIKRSNLKENSYHKIKTDQQIQVVQSPNKKQQVVKKRQQKHKEEWHLGQH